MSEPFRETHDKVIVFLTDELGNDDVADEETLHLGLKGAFLRALQMRKRLVIDLGGVNLLSYTPMSCLLYLHSLPNAETLDIRIANMNTSLQETFKVLQLNKLFKLDDDSPESTASD
jgi:anti-anti-sigma regulatory factor